MISPLHRSTRSPLVALVLAASALVAVGCGDASTGSTSWHPGGTSLPSSGSANSGSSGNGASNASSSSGGSSTGSGSTATPDPTGGGSTSTDPTPAPTGTTPTAPGTPPTTTPAAPAFDVMIDNAKPSVDLMSEQSIQVTVAPQSYTGDVALTVTGIPTDVTATFDKATLSVSGTAGATAKLTLKSLSSTKPGAISFNVVATAGATTKMAPATLDVKSVLTIRIPVNVDANTGPDVFGTINVTAPANMSAQNPVTVNFLNTDTTPHEIHGSQGTQGFPHGKGTFAQNQSDTPRLLNTAGLTYNFYLHDQGSAKTPGKIVISK